MQIIIISPNGTSHRHWHISPKILLLSLFAFLCSFIFIGSQLYSKSQPVTIPQLSSTATTDDVELVQIIEPVKQLQQVETYYAKRLGSLQAEAIRLSALTEKLASMSGFDTSEFSLNNYLNQGGVDQSGSSLSSDEFDQHVSELESYFNGQSAQLLELQDYLITEDSIESAIPNGRPIEGGWISSYYGKRIDPFNGKKVFHHGLDFAGKAGSNVLAVADGIVSWKGKRGGYGEMIDIDHGNGYVTRYAHNKTLVVNVGDRVKQGDTIALMGSTGRSTGPHVHFEVLRDGKAINPYNFVKR